MRGAIFSPSAQQQADIAGPLLLTSSEREDDNPQQAIVINDDDQEPSKIGSSLAERMAPRVLPSVGAFTVQCAMCLKWRLIPSKKMYEEIRESILERPFLCNSATSWRPGLSCEEASDLAQDMSHVWAIDRPNIPLAPPGWERLLVLRGAGASKFADVYYVAPTGRKLRSMPDVERFLFEHPEYVAAGVSLRQFSFVIPKPLDKNYCRKRVSSGEVTGSMMQKQPKVDSSKAKYGTAEIQIPRGNDKSLKYTGRMKSLARVVSSERCTQAYDGARHTDCYNAHRSNPVQQQHVSAPPHNLSWPQNSDASASLPGRGDSSNRFSVVLDDQYEPATSGLAAGNDQEYPVSIVSANENSCTDIVLFSRA